VALVHDWLTGMRGGEKCLESFLHLFPEADVYTILHVPGSVSPAIEARVRGTSFVQRLPLARRRYRYYLPLFPLAVETFDLGGYDLVISLSHCAAKGVITGPATRHVCYCLTPLRYAWDQYHAYFGHLGGLRGFLMRYAMGRIRQWDAVTAGRPDEFLTISRYVAARIAKYYRREARVVYPPVDTGFFTPGDPSPGDFYLVVSAMVPYKRLELVLEAAPRLPHPVVIAGTGPEERRLRAMAPPAVRFTGWLPDGRIRELYRTCRALLFPGEEDFGITPVEAMACGRPVVAFGRGGVTETVVPPGDPRRPPTGILFADPSPESLAAAVGELETRRDLFVPDTLRRHAESFSRERFQREILSALFPGEGGTSPGGVAGGER
jgi:glycosyltransferase involved in cell wall biosynthesis